MSLFIIALVVFPVFTSKVDAIEDKVTGYIIDETDSPLANVKVSIYPKSGQEQSKKLLLTVFSSNDGVYVITGLPPGKYDLQFECSGFNTQIVSIEIRGQSALVANIKMIADKSCPVYSGADIQLSDEDKSEIISKILTNEIKDGRHVIKLMKSGEGKIYLKSTDITQELTLGLPNTSVEFLPAADLIERAKVEDKFEYGTLSILKIIGNCVRISILWKSSGCLISPDPCVLGGEGATYKLTKGDRGWTCQYVAGWIS
jgi:hypothetical protein